MSYIIRMKGLKVIITLILMGQIFATPLMNSCDMSDLASETGCCVQTFQCECDDDLPEKIESIKKQVKTSSYDFHFDYKFNSVLEEIVSLEKNETISLENHHNFVIDPPKRVRAKLQVFII